LGAPLASGGKALGVTRISVPQGLLPRQVVPFPCIMLRSGVVRVYAALGDQRLSTKRHLGSDKGIIDMAQITRGKP